MDFQSFLKDKSKRKWTFILIATTLVLIILSVFIGYSTLINFALNQIDAYLTIIERIADRILHLAGSEVSIKDHQVYSETEFDATINSQYLLKKWTLFLFILFWLTPTVTIRKIKFTGLLLLGSFIGSIMNIGFSSHLMSLTPDVNSAYHMGRTPHALLMLSLFITWIWRERKNLLKTLAKKKINLGFLEEKLPAIFLVLFVYVLMSNFLLGCFQYSWWINFLFNTTAWILNIMNVPAWVESHLLIGENGSIYMAKGCLGFNTMLLFAAIVYLSGKNDKSKWLFIIGGVILLNIANIVRFVLLFMHIQKHGGYVLSIDLHDMYNYVIYGIVFILWIIWFEKYSDIRET
ncbi:archaeosortase/exosortase family protein [Bacteroidota bacterium]